MVENRQKLKLKNIYIDPIQWDMLGEKVGSLNRSAWIRQRIDEELKVPDDPELLKAERIKQEKYLDTLKEKENRIISKREEIIENQGDLKTRMKRAMRRVRKNIKDNSIHTKTRNIERYEIGLDLLKEIGIKYEIDYEELQKEVIAKINVKFVRIHDVGITESGKSLSEYLR